jgi:tetratricopeptide (TPR) repeat protein
LIQKAKHFDPEKRFPVRTVQARRPFWMPAASFYVLAGAVAMAFFFVIWGVFRGDGDDTPIIVAGFSVSIVLGGAVFLREFVFRMARNRVLETQKQLDRSLKGVALSSGIHSGRSDKLTLELNAAILREIKQKSEAARVLASMSSGHKEVFELCDRYLLINGRELTRVRAGSPRLAALLKGKELAEEFHRYHMLRWAEIEAKALSSAAQNSSKTSVRIDAAQRALSVVSSAIEHYPDESNLNASGDAIREFLSSVKLSSRIEKAESAVARGNYKQARKYYAEALQILDRENVPSDEREFAVSQINEALQQIDQLES